MKELDMSTLLAVALACIIAVCGFTIGYEVGKYCAREGIKREIVARGFANYERKDGKNIWHWTSIKKEDERPCASCRECHLMPSQFKSFNK